MWSFTGPVNPAQPHPQHIGALKIKGAHKFFLPAQNYSTARRWTDVYVHMANLPEEVLDLIFSKVNPPLKAPYLTRPDSQTLSAVCLASRQFRRIARPYLYQYIHSPSGSKGRSLERTLSLNPELAASVRYFSVQHTTEGCYNPVDAHIKQMDLYGAVEDMCTSLLASTLPLLSNVTVLDLSRFNCNPMTTALSSLMVILERYMKRKLAQGASLQLRHLALHVSTEPLNVFFPLFKTPSLRSIELDMRPRRFRPVIARGLTCLPHIESVSIVGYTLARRDDLACLKHQCPSVSNLLVTAKVLEELLDVAEIFAPDIRSGTLKRIQVAVVGLWYYDVELVPSTLKSRALAEEFLAALTYVSGRHDPSQGRFDVSSKCQGIRSIGMRELTDEEKRAYDLRLARRP